METAKVNGGTERLTLEGGREREEKVLMAAWLTVRKAILDVHINIYCRLGFIGWLALSLKDIFPKLIFILFYLNPKMGESHR